MDYIEEYKKNEVKVTNEDIIPISYRIQGQFKKAFFDYLKRKK